MGLLLLAFFVLDLAFSFCSSISIEVGETLSSKLHMVEAAIRRLGSYWLKENCNLIN